MREDIDRKLGCCLLDPTAGGETAYRLLGYCIEKKRENVLFLDTDHSYPPYSKTLGFQPFKYQKGEPTPKLRHVSTDVLMTAIRALFNVKDPAETSRIERYLPAVFTALYDAKRPLSDGQLFSNRLHKDAQLEILSETDDNTRTDILEAFSTASAYSNFQSTVGRLLRFVRAPLQGMFSVNTGVNWMKMVREHWVVIARLDNLDAFSARLLGTYIIAELESAKARLNEAIDSRKDLKDRGNYPPYYLYADEAFMFASQSLKNMLDLRQKLNFKVTLAHHTASQFDQNPEVYQSIKTNCDMTVEFYTRSRRDRDDISREMYGGDINPEDASYANSALPKQSAVIKIGKDGPKRDWIPTVPTPDITNAQLQAYLKNLYQNPWYYDSRKSTYKDTSRPQSRKTSNRKTTSATTLPAGIRKRRGEGLSKGNEKSSKAPKGGSIKV